VTANKAHHIAVAQQPAVGDGEAKDREPEELQRRSARGKAARDGGHGTGAGSTGGDRDESEAEGAGDREAEDREPEEGQRQSARKRAPETKRRTKAEVNGGGGGANAHRRTHDRDGEANAGERATETEETDKRTHNRDGEANAGERAGETHEGDTKSFRFTLWFDSICRQPVKAQRERDRRATQEAECRQRDTILVCCPAGKKQRGNPNVPQRARQSGGGIPTRER